MYAFDLDVLQSCAIPLAHVVVKPFTTASNRFRDEKAIVINHVPSKLKVSPLCILFELVSDRLK